MTERKLTDRQMEMLDRVCSSNGGGIFAGFSEGQSETKLLRSLERRGLVQGKAGNPACAVHTREGLALWRRQTALTSTVSHDVERTGGGAS